MTPRNEHGYPTDIAAAEHHRSVADLYDDSEWLDDAADRLESNGNFKMCDECRKRAAELRGETDN